MKFILPNSPKFLLALYGIHSYSPNSWKHGSIAIKCFYHTLSIAVGIDKENNYYSYVAFPKEFMYQKQLHKIRIILLAQTFPVIICDVYLNWLTQQIIHSQSPTICQKQSNIIFCPLCA